MLADDALRVAGLEAASPIERNFATNIEMKVCGGRRGSAERREHPAARVHRVCPDDLELGQGVCAQPCGEVRLDGHEPLHAHLRNLGLDVNRAGIKAHGFRLEPGDLAVAEARADPGEEAEREVGTSSPPSNCSSIP